VTGLVSVVIPVRNGSRYLREAIQSVLDQDYTPIEVLVVDNGSEDDSRAIAASMSGPVRVIEEPTPGASHARNTGAKLAQGEYLAFQDADDLWAPTKLTQQVRVLQTCPDVDLVFTHGQNFISPELRAAGQTGDARPAVAQAWISPAAMLARRASFLRAGWLPDLREGEFIAWYGIAQSQGLRTTVIPDVLVQRRIHLSNSTGQQRPLQDYVRAAKLVLDQRRKAQPPRT
jgi:glycosyltransferase involved in cell wall biosynthesis